MIRALSPLRPNATGHPALAGLPEGAVVLRVDDYPTGVRPVPADLALIHRVLDEIERRGLTFHLGIVPKLLTGGMEAHLRGLKHLVPVVHGHDHGQACHTPKLLAAGDPENRRDTVGAFDEFAGLDAAAITTRLAEGRRILEGAFGRPVTGYIPPCNRSNRATGQALVAAGYSHYFSERRIPGCPLPGLASDFYARSDRWKPRRRRPRVVTLHATWEADLLRAGDERSLARLLEVLT